MDKDFLIKTNNEIKKLNNNKKESKKIPFHDYYKEKFLGSIVFFTITLFLFVFIVFFKDPIALHNTTFIVFQEKPATVFLNPLMICLSSAILFFVSFFSFLTDDDSYIKEKPEEKYIEKNSFSLFKDFFEIILLLFVLIAFLVFIISLVIIPTSVVYYLFIFVFSIDVSNFHIFNFVLFLIPVIFYLPFIFYYFIKNKDTKNEKGQVNFNKKKTEILNKIKTDVKDINDFLYLEFIVKKYNLKSLKIILRDIEIMLIKKHNVKSIDELKEHHLEQKMNNKEKNIFTINNN